MDIQQEGLGYFVLLLQGVWASFVASSSIGCAVTIIGGVVWLVEDGGVGDDESGGGRGGEADVDEGWEEGGVEMVEGVECDRSMEELQGRRAGGEDQALREPDLGRASRRGEPDHVRRD